MEPTPKAPEESISRTPPESGTSDVTHISEAAKSVIDRILSRSGPKEISDEEWREREAKREQRRRESEVSDLMNFVGSRYAGCSISGFNIDGEEPVQNAKREVVRKLVQLGKNLSDHREAGGNLFIYGPSGTGKDHLMISLLRHAILAHGYRVFWCNGQTLIGDFRDNIDKDVTERELLAKYSKPDILAISDPVPPKGVISPYATSMLYRIIDERYRTLRPTWVTVNVATNSEAVEQLGGAVLDRLRENAVTVFCNWPSFRQARKPEWLK